MNILMLLDGEFPPDERVEKEALSLIGNGYTVNLICLNFTGQKSHELHKGINIFRISIPKTLRNKLLGTYLISPLYRLFWEYNVLKFLKRNDIDVLHIHDLPLSDIGIRLKKSKKIRVVLDQHEYYSKYIVNTAHYNTPAGRVVKLLSRWDRYENKYLPRADMVITVEEPLKKLYISNCGIAKNKIVVLPNTPSALLFNNNNIDRETVEKYNNRFVVFYAGNIDILRGLDTIIKAISLLKNKIPELRFVFAGRFNPKYYDPLKTIEDLKVAEITEFLGWIPLTALPSYIAASKICIHVPPVSSDEVNNSISTKIYQYLLMHKPIIVGQAEMMRKFVETNKIGLSIKESDPEDLAEKIYSLYSSPELMQEFSDNAGKIAGDYTWEKTSSSFLNNYQQLKL